MTPLAFVLLASLVLIFIARLSLPSVILRVLSRKIAALKGYSGSTRAVRLSLIRAKLILLDTNIRKAEVDNPLEKPFFHAPEITVTFQWKPLFTKKVVADVVINRAEINFIKKNSSEAPSAGTGTFNLKSSIESLRPFIITVRLVNSAIYYTELRRKSAVQLELTELNAILSEFSIIPHSIDPLPVKFVASAYVYGGTLSFAMGLDPLASALTFDMNTNVRNIQLPLLNDFLRAHAGIDVNAGTFEMYTEIAARNGAFKGYIKPIIRNLDLVGGQDKNDKLLTRVWEGFVATVYQILKNRSADQFATRISIEGTLDDPHVNIISAVLSILRNAFIRAIKPSFEDVISLKSVRRSVSVGKAIKRFFSKTPSPAKK